MGFAQILAVTYAYIHRIPEFTGACIYVHVLWIGGVGPKCGQIFVVEEIHDEVSVGKFILLDLYK